MNHFNPGSGRKSKAPYNFVPLPEAVYSVPRFNENFAEYNSKAHTGWIDLTLTTETPLYIRCGPDVNDIRNCENGEQDHAKLTRRHQHRQNFFHHGNPKCPVIPGSSMRGMIRSLVEILGFGKMQWFTDKKLIYRAVGDTSSLGELYRDQMMGPNQKSSPKMLFEYPVSQLRGGYLEKNGPDWTIRPAREFHSESFVHVEYSACPNGTRRVEKVFVRPPVSRTQPPRCNPDLKLNLAYIDSSAHIVRATPSTAKPSGFEKGVLVRSGHIGGSYPKHMHCVIYEKDSSANPIPIPTPMWKLYEDDRDMTRNRRREPRKLKKDDDPLFYLVNSSDELVFFGPTMMFRLPYKRSIRDFVPQKIRNPKTIDIADAIFGTIDSDRPIKSRVFFEDLRWKGQNSPFIGRCSPKILSGPKPTAFQHYLTQKQPNNKAKLNHYGSSPKQTRLRGHKRYWHKRDADPFENKLKNRDCDTQHTVIRPVKKATVFKGRVRFENLSNLELGALLSALQLPCTMRHQLGMGKPLGMGTVKIETTLHISMRTGNKNRYTSLFDNTQLNLGELSEKENLNIAKDAREEFRKDIVQHYNNNATMNSVKVKAIADIWDIPRLEVLALMLEWKNPPDRTETEYQLLTAPAWKKRHVLPNPRDIANLAPTGTSPPTTQQQAAPAPPIQHGDQIKSRIEKLGGKGDVSQVPEIVKQIAGLPDSNTKLEYAKQLRKWLQQGKKSLWKDTKHSATDWRKQLDKIL